MDGKLVSAFGLLLATAVGLGALIGILLPGAKVISFDATELPKGWRQIEWPFLNDQFGAGVALECLGPGCAALIKVTVRPKIGFCNCVTGIADDEELDRIGDIGLISGGYEPVSPGAAIRIRGLSGRQRTYATSATADVISIAYNNGCDAVAVTARSVLGESAYEDVHRLLESSAVHRWVSSRLGL